MADLVRLSVSDGIAWLVLNRPQVLNALDQAIVQEYAAHVLTLRERKDVRVILTRGEGRGFCAGSDLHELSGMSAAEAASSERQQAEAFALLDSLPQPTIALTHGYALGGGLQVALYHDFHLTTESATLGLPEVELGWTPPWAVGRLMDVVGNSTARWLLLTCTKIRGEQAREIGLVNEVVPDDQLLQRGETLARQLASFPPEGLKRTKTLLNQMSPLRQDHWDAHASAAFEHCFRSPKCQERLEAFTARRKK
jgi:enoyl-CoA hydratase